jgi:ubiquitin-conjugating enzyme E2 J2
VKEMASPKAIRKLTNEYKNLLEQPVKGLRVVPNPSNILEWHYLITGPEDSPYAGGEYYGKLIFPTSYPLSPPKIMMCTPSGRFTPNHRICTSMSDYHPETWSPGWTLSTILVGLISFMVDDNDGGVGCVQSSKKEKQNLAIKSHEYNKQYPERKWFDENQNEIK